MKKNTHLIYKQYALIDELQSAEKEFGEIISQRWEILNSNTKLQKKALMGAKRIKELRLLLMNHKILPVTIQ
ncbi:MAG: hypothetical protein N3A54_02425 [Patescibacteria group bacterium]|nr:hypothetical protein [Patescibacteria group bacterium]